MMYIFGGFGNETGKQEHVGRNLYDLYKLNIASQHITKLWELPEVPKFEFIPGKILCWIMMKINFMHFAMRIIGQIMDICADLTHPVVASRQ